MTPLLRKWMVPVLSISILTASYFFIYSHMHEIAESEPDRYYHLALAKMTAEHGLIRRLPQVVGIGWDKTFPEKNFLFTALTAITYRWGGETATLALVPFLALVFLFSLFSILRFWIGWVAATAFIVLAILAPPDFANRLVLLRPHLLAMSCFLFLLHGILVESALLCFLGSLAFALSYHAVYVPVALLACAFLARIGRSSSRSLYAGLVGIAVGILVNPYFPLNLKMGFTSFKIAVNASALSPFERPIEMVPLTTEEFLKRYGFHVAILLWAAITVFYFSKKEKKEEAKDSNPLIFLFIASVSFWLLTAVSRRALEYAAPLSVLCLGFLASTLSRKRVAAEIVLLLFLALQLPTSLPFFWNKPTTIGDTHQLLEAVGKIPVQESGKFVFNCEWGNSPFLLYKRPQLKFLDLSDPTLLLEASPRAYYARINLRQGAVAYPFGLLRGGFGADYVMCGRGKLVEQLERDAHFERLYPSYSTDVAALPPGAPFLYRVASRPLPNLVGEYRGAIVSRAPSSETLPKIPLLKTLKAESSPYFNLSNAPTGACSVVSPVFSDHHQGATLLGLGGGPQIQIWWNGMPLYSSIDFHDRPRYLEVFVPLPHPLSKKDHLQAVICSKKESPYLGFALSLWRKDEVEELCAKRGSPPIPSASTSFWKFSDQPTSTCLAPIAMRSPSIP